MSNRKEVFNYPLEVAMKSTFAHTRRLSSAKSRLGLSTLLALAATISVPAAADTAYQAPSVLAVEGLTVVGQDGVAPDTAPVPVSMTKLSYPSRAMDRGKEGWLIVELAIDETGIPYDAEVVRSEGSVLFNHSSLKAVESFRFAPATLDGKAVAVTGKRYKVVYNLKDG